MTVEWRKNTAPNAPGFWDLVIDGVDQYLWVGQLHEGEVRYKPRGPHGRYNVLRASSLDAAKAAVLESIRENT